MSAFGKFKNCPPPMLPRRRDDHAEPERQQDENEDDDEYGDMYEVPPCERTITVPQISREENIYLERTSSPAPHQRRIPPPPLPNFSKPISGDVLNSQNIKPPDVNRTAKPGRMKMTAPPPQPDEDVYLDPNEEQEDAEDLYLEPEACALPPNETKKKPAFFKPAILSSDLKLKLPIPPDKLSSPTATAPEVEARRFSLPKLTPPVPGKPRPPTNQKESRPEPPALENIPVGKTNVLELKVKEVTFPPPACLPGDVTWLYTQSPSRQAASFGSGRVKSPNENREWFAGDCNRKTAEDLLLSVNKDGAFLIRNSSTHNAHQPYTLAVLYQRKVYNIPVRFLDDAQGYALGKEGKKNEEIFSTLDEMISYHQNNQLLLIDSKSQAKHTTYLTYTAHL